MAWRVSHALATDNKPHMLKDLVAYAGMGWGVLLRIRGLLPYPAIYAVSYYLDDLYSNLTTSPLTGTHIKVNTSVRLLECFIRVALRSNGP